MTAEVCSNSIMLLCHEKFLGLSIANQAVLPIRIWLFKEGLSHHMYHWKNKPFSLRTAPSLPSASLRIHSWGPGSEAHLPRCRSRSRCLLEKATRKLCVSACVELFCCSQFLEGLPMGANHLVKGPVFQRALLLGRGV